MPQTLVYVPGKSREIAGGSSRVAYPVSLGTEVISIQGLVLNYVRRHSNE